MLAGRLKKLRYSVLYQVVAFASLRIQGNEFSESWMVHLRQKLCNYSHCYRDRKESVIDTNNNCIQMQSLSFSDEIARLLDKSRNNFQNNLRYIVIRFSIDCSDSENITPIKRQRQNTSLVILCLNYRTCLTNKNNMEML